MKILFVCRHNVGRSQMAMEFFNKLLKKHKADSCGTHVENDHGKTLAEHTNVVNCMKELAIDISKNKRKQLTKELADKFDKIVVITEKENCPDYLLKSKKSVFWKVEDGKGKDYAFTCKMRDQVKALVGKLVKEIDNFIGNVHSKRL